MMQPKITESEILALRSGDLREIRVGRASLSHNQRMAETPDLDGPDARWVMESPTTGTHTLLIAATDLERLNAHWRGFVETANSR
jgi:hypothetical protein